MKKINVGILAHVDAGKTTLSEALLYTAGAIKKLGRVDHKDAYLDTNRIERDRGITIFSKEARLCYKQMEICLLDTPGHVDFSAEAERALQVLDYAILVISGSEGVQSHTETLWRLLRHYHVPTFLFINKMDLAGADKHAVFKKLAARLSAGCVDATQPNAAFYEACAGESEALLEAYLESGTLSDELLRTAVAAEQIFPCFFGAALKNEGVEDFLDGMLRLTMEKTYPTTFSARVYKISEDEKGQRLTHLKVTGGSLAVKTLLGQEKVNEIRLYSGKKYTTVAEAPAGTVCAVTGLLTVHAGQGFGEAPEAAALLSEPVFTYALRLPPEKDPAVVLAVLRRLAEEEPQLRVLWHGGKILVQIMGNVQLEVFTRILWERFQIQAEFTEGTIIYKETIANTVEGVGHYEPLRHYAEVHLQLAPAPQGTGLVFRTACNEDVLDKNWQRLILTHLQEKTHLGVLTGSAITDMIITLTAGRAHQKHTEGGDFRQATYRAVRQGLMQAESVLLEPYYTFTLTVPAASVGRAMTDLQRMGAEMEPPETDGETTVLTGSAPVAVLRGYPADVTAYTHGRGTLRFQYKGYAPCHNPQEVIEAFGYAAEKDVENTADSVFCTHGSGFIVKWDAVFDHMHLPKTLQADAQPKSARVSRPQYMDADDETLLAIYERTYGKINRNTPAPLHTERKADVYRGKAMPQGPTYLLIDGYNIIFAWESLQSIAKENLEDARMTLIRRICNYKAVRPYSVILVFDAYRVPGMQREMETVHGISVIYTKEAETADAYIEKTAKVLSREYRVRVATSDRLEQVIIFGNGAVRISAAEFEREVLAAEAEIRDFIARNNLK
ncbi:MAG: TetM/TetW/TetO/TetS family tetracycline resistance ribosomal protection protein [Clostridia bacterium]|nr:TetM/TetW/TetO/TetS family tetracycline resistance ribosomal protection protein [Clostridia bacterium]